MWHVIQDPSSNQFFRLNEAAYRFVALLDGRRNVAGVWRICQDQLGDSAPTQGEAIQLLGQLYTSNLLHAELPPDAEGLFKRHQKRVHREVQGYLMNLMFIRVPLLDPDNFLNAWVSAVNWLFTWFGFALWLGLIGTGLYFAIDKWQDLYNRADSVLDADNLPFLYLSFVLIKVVHEFGHAFMCKVFGRRTGTGGEVHVMGVMFLVFTPMPYVDASSAWAFRSRGQRMLVGAGGMIVELAVAAVAAIVWYYTGEGAVHTIAYNVMFIASVSTLLFNANPLLRYDGYYILSDILEIPNLAQRSKQYLYYLVRKYAWSVKQARNPAHSRGEKGWFVFYGIASTIYRVLICVSILLFVADKLFMFGLVLAVAAAVAWVVVPIGKFVHYLLTNGELMRVRGRAIVSTLATLAAIVVGVGFVPAPDNFRLEGYVDPVRQEIVHAAADGFVTGVMESNRRAAPGGEPLLRTRSPELAAQLEELLAQQRELKARRWQAMTKDQAQAQIIAEQIAALDERKARITQQLDSLTVRASFGAEWISPDIDRARGSYLRRGDAVGMLASSKQVGGEAASRDMQVVIRAMVSQDVVDMLLAGATDADSGRDRAVPPETQPSGRWRKLTIRIKGLPDVEMTGRIIRVIEAGQDRLANPALGYAAGGSIRTDPKDPKGMKTSERFFEVEIEPQPVQDPATDRRPAGVWHGRVPLLIRQRVIVRVEMPPRPLIQQWYRSILQLVQRRFQI
jgi:putative peptide zinc metalloprotease protein